jgi:hypothetical protein
VDFLSSDDVIAALRFVALPHVVVGRFVEFYDRHGRSIRSIPLEHEEFLNRVRNGTAWNPIRLSNSVVFCRRSQHYHCSLSTLSRNYGRNLYTITLIYISLESEKISLYNKIK